jgi:hypothetical protein
VLFGVAVVAGCAHDCTDIGCIPGVSVNFSNTFNVDLLPVVVTACADKVCHTERIDPTDRAADQSTFGASALCCTFGVMIGQSWEVSEPSTAERRRQLSMAGRHAEFKRRSFDGVDLSVVYFNQLWLDRCTFRDSDLRHATLDRCHFKLCDFSRANLRGASLRYAWFAACDLRGADLRDCDLTGARFGWVTPGPTKVRTDVTGVHWSAGAKARASFDDVIGLEE